MLTLLIGIHWNIEQSGGNVVNPTRLWINLD